MLSLGNGIEFHSGFIAAFVAGAVLMDSLHHADEDEETLDMGERPLKSVADSGNQGQAHSSVKSGKGAEEMQDFKTFDEEADEDDDVLIVEEEVSSVNSNKPSIVRIGTIRETQNSYGGGGCFEVLFRENFVYHREV